MTRPSIFNFIVQKEARSITVERSFNAPLDPVWVALTEADILCKWWAPKPYECVITLLDFREGGRWSYYMQSPEGDRHYGFFDYLTVNPKTFYSGQPAFCDEQGAINAAMPRSTWECSFNESDGTTLVRSRINYPTQEALETIVQMGLKEGFTMGLEQLDELLAERTK